MVSTKIEAVVATLFAVTLLVFPGCQSDGRRIAAQSVDASSETVAPKPQSADRPAGELPRFAAEGVLMRPEGWEAWVMVGASLGLSYSEGGAAEMAGAGPDMFHNVYMQPWAYRRFL